MNRILEEIKRMINENINNYLPDVKLNELEENGKIYYMNGQNGTSFDWYTNDHLSSFMVFYNDENNLGAAKLLIYKNGKVQLFLYGENGNKNVKEINTSINVTEDELFNLAVVLKNEADDKRIWDASIDKINTDISATYEQIEEFKKAEKYSQTIKNDIDLLNKEAYVSKKVLEDWKVGYMYREEPDKEYLSGWAFLAGNEDDEYVNNTKNISIKTIYEISKLDPDVLKYIDSPVGTRLIRISSNEFEIDNDEKEIYIEKRKK